MVLVDQFGGKHKTDAITFYPSPRPAQNPNTGGIPITCFFCNQSIAMQDLSEICPMPAHKGCVR